MKNNKKSKETYFFIGFGVLTVLSGLYMAFQQDYVTGISGAIVGAFIIYLNTKQRTDVEGK